LLSCVTDTTSYPQPVEKRFVASSPGRWGHDAVPHPRFGIPGSLCRSVNQQVETIANSVKDIPASAATKTGSNRPASTPTPTLERGGRESGAKQSDANLDGAITHSCRTSTHFVSFDCNSLQWLPFFSCSPPAKCRSRSEAQPGVGAVYSEVSVMAFESVPTPHRAHFATWLFGSIWVSRVDVPASFSHQSCERVVSRR
jgi:hypothetical protein